MAKSPLLSAREDSNFARKTSEHEGVITGDVAEDGFRKLETKSAATPATENEEIKTLNDNSSYGAGQFQDGTSLDSYEDQPKSVIRGEAGPTGRGFKSD